jgi:hypothetical protein
MDIQSANKQHPVPQNVMDVEFKLIGELTIRQFSYLLVFTLLAFGAASAGIPVIFKYPLVPFLVLTGLAFAFLPFNDITLDKWVANYISAITTPRLRVWKHVQRVPYFFTLDTSKIKEDPREQRSPLKPRGSISDFLNQGSAKDIDFEDESDLQKNEEDFFKSLGLDVAPTTKTSKPSQQVNTAQPVASTQPTLQQQATKDLVDDEAHTKDKFSSIALSSQNIPTNTQQKDQTTGLNVKNSDQEDNHSNQESVDKKHYEAHMQELNLLKEKLVKDIEKNKYRVLEDKKRDVQEVVKRPADPAKTVDLPSTQPATQKLTKQQGPTKPTLESEITTSKKPKTPIFKKLLRSLGGSGNVQPAKKIPKDTVNTNQNNLSGSIVDDKSNVIAEAIVIVKNEDGDPIRALKTNSVGQFESTTPLDNGVFTIEAIKEGYSFTPITLKALGSSLNPVKLVGTKNK